MREIKFRAWLNGSMYYNHSVTISINGEVFYLANSGEWIQDETGVVKLMRYAEMKDKNGKEIYENDIVNSLMYPYEEQVSVNKIEFKNGCWKLVSDGKGDIPLYLYGELQLEVIGNIYENDLQLN